MVVSKNISTLFLKFMALLIVVVFSYLVLLYTCIVTSKDKYIAAIFDKMDRLEKTSPPRLIFVGGSNLAYGIDSSEISRAFSVPVVNMGLIAGLGLKFMLDQVKPYLKKGDVVVVVPEYGHLVGDAFYGDPVELIQVAGLTNNMSVIANIPLLKLADALMRCNTFIFSYKSNSPKRNWFNGEGDEIYHLSLPDRTFPKTELMDGKINHIALQYLYDFEARNRIRGISTYLMFPCLEKHSYALNAVKIKTIADALRKKGIHTLSSPQEFIYDEDKFYNSVYHLNRQGRQLRTEKMIQVIKDALHSQ